MNAAIIVEDANGNGRALAAWLNGCGCTSTVVADAAEADATIVYQQLAGSGRLLMFAPLAPASLAHFKSLRANSPEVERGFYTQSPARDHDAALMASHGLVAILHQPFAGESPSALGLSADPSTRAAASAISAVTSAETRTAAPTAAISAMAAMSARVLPPDPPDELPAAPPSAPVTAAANAPVRMAPAVVSLADARADVPPDKRRSLWIALIEDQPGCCRALSEELARPGLMVKMLPSWQEAGDLALHALSTGLVVGPLSSDSVRLCRRLNEAANASQIILYSESESQTKDARLPIQYGCLAIVRKPLNVDVLLALVEQIRTPGWKPPQRELPPATTGRAARPERAAGTAAWTAATPGTPAAPLTTRVRPVGKPPVATPPLSGLAAIRARKDTEKDTEKPGSFADLIDTGSVAQTRQRLITCPRCGEEALVPMGRNECPKCSGGKG